VSKAFAQELAVEGMMTHAELLEGMMTHAFNCGVAPVFRLNA
jgi:hypothetical protein